MLLFLLSDVGEDLLGISNKHVDESFWVGFVAGNQGEGAAVVPNYFLFVVDQVALSAIQRKYLVPVFLSEVDEPE